MKVTIRAILKKQGSFAYMYLNIGELEQSCTDAAQSIDCF